MVLVKDVWFKCDAAIEMCLVVCFLSLFRKLLVCGEWFLST